MCQVCAGRVSLCGSIGLDIFLITPSLSQTQQPGQEPMCSNHLWKAYTDIRFFCRRNPALTPRIETSCWSLALKTSNTSFIFSACFGTFSFSSAASSCSSEELMSSAGFGLLRQSPVCGFPLSSWSACAGFALAAVGRPAALPRAAHMCSLSSDSIPLAQAQ